MWFFQKIKSQNYWSENYFFLSKCEFMRDANLNECRLKRMSTVLGRGGGPIMR